MLSVNFIFFSFKYVLEISLLFSSVHLILATHCSRFVRRLLAVSHFQTTAGEADVASEMHLVKITTLSDAEGPSVNITVTSRLHFILPSASEDLRLGPKGNCILASVKLIISPYTITALRTRLRPIIQPGDRSSGG